MNDTELRCFIAVADNLSFTKAAEELYFSVSTVTHHVHNLEQELGTELFYRTSRSVSLTVEGEIFYMSAKLILDDENEALQNLKHGMQLHALRIGCTSNSEAYRTVPLLKKMISSYRQIVPEIYVENHHTIVRMLDAQTLDFAFGPYELSKGNDLTYEELCRMSVYAVFNQDDPLAISETIQFADISDNSLLIPGPRAIPFDVENQAVDVLNKHYQKCHDRFVDCENDGFPLVQAGYGIMVVPEYCIPPNIDTLGMTAVPISDFEKFSYGVLYKSGPDIELREFVLNCCRTYLTDAYPSND